MTLLFLTLSSVAFFGLGYSCAYKLGYARGQAAGIAHRYGKLIIDNPRKDL